MIKELIIGSEERILVIAPHPDDECIATGGLLSLYGPQCEVWLITDGSKGSVFSDRADIALIRHREFEREMEFLNVSAYRFFDIEDGKAALNLDLLINEKLSVFSKIFIPNCYDIHSDHVAVFEMLCKACICQKVSSIEIFQYEVGEPLDTYTHYLDITSVIDKKINAIGFHHSQNEQYDYCEMAKSLNHYRAIVQGKRYSYYESYKITKLYAEEIREEYELNNLKRIQEVQDKNDFLEMIIGVYSDLNRLEVFVKNMNKKIAIYAYGVYGGILESLLLQANVKIEFIIDRFKAGKMDITRHRTKLINLVENDDDNIMIIIAMYEKNSEIESSIHSCGFKNTIWLCDWMMQVLKENEE